MGDKVLTTSATWGHYEEQLAKVKLYRSDGTLTTIAPRVFS